MTAPRQFLIASEAGIAVREMSDISGAIAATFGTAGLILTESDLTPEFFDLKTGLAGELLRQGQSQRIEGRHAPEVREATRSRAFGSPLPREARDSRTARPSENIRFAELAREHRTHNSIRILRTQDEAQAWAREFSSESASAASCLDDRSADMVKRIA